MTQTPSNFTRAVKTTVNSDCTAGKAAAAAPGSPPFVTLSPRAAARRCLGLTDHSLRMYLSCLFELRFLARPITREPEPPLGERAAQANRKDMLKKGKGGGKLTIKVFRILLETLLYKR